MKLKYYLRGLGVGIFVTALIMGLSLGKNQKMSDEEVIARAKELGMVEKEAEGSVLSETIAETIEAAKPEETEPVVETDVQDSKPETEGTTQEETEETSLEETKEATPEETREEPEKESVTPSESEKENISQEDENILAGQVVSITIVSGDDSAVISRKLEEAGLVVSASSYDRFLCDNGYARKLSPGTYEIAIGSSEETIAKIITKSR